MRFIKNNLSVLALTVAVMFVCAGANAGNISIVDFTDDAGTGISIDKTYTHLFDMGGITTTAATVNDVSFTLLTHGPSGTHPTVLTAPNFQLETIPMPGEDGGYNHASSPTNAGVSSDQGVYDLLYDLLFTNGEHSNQTMTLSGLTPESTYDFRLYYRSWSSDSRNATLTFDEGNGQPIVQDINEDGSDGSYASYVSYEYIASASGILTVNIAHADPDTGWHLHGMSNELVSGPSVPEPSTLALLACGLFGLLAYAWRKRK